MRAAAGPASRAWSGRSCAAEGRPVGVACPHAAQAWIRPSTAFFSGPGRHQVRRGTTRGGAGGGIMTERGARETRTLPRAGPGARRKGSPGRSRMRAAAGGGASRYRNPRGGTAWRGRSEGGRARRIGGEAGRCPGGGAGRGAPRAKKRVETAACGTIEAPREGSVRGRLARDNCCYREPNCRFQRCRPTTRRPSDLAPPSVTAA